MDFLKTKNQIVEYAPKIQKPRKIKKDKHNPNNNHSLMTISRLSPFCKLADREYQSMTKLSGHDENKA
jgi:hypothetical protein